MPRKPAITPNRSLHTTLPPDLSARLDLLLFSESEGRVPAGAIQSLLIRLLWEFFSLRRYDLAPFLPGSMPGEHVIQASDATLNRLLNHLKVNVDGNVEQ